METERRPRSQEQAFDTVVIGGGIVGLATAVALAARHHRVAVIDAGYTPGTSSWAGGGILAPLYPWSQPAAIHPLVYRSQALYPELCQRIWERTEIDPELRSQGMLYLDLPPDRPLEKELARRWAREQGVGHHELASDRVTAYEPLVDSKATGGLLFPDVAWIRTPRFLRGMARLAQILGVELWERRTALGISLSRRTFTHLQTDAGPVEAKNAVIAAGAWSRGLLAPLGIDLPVDPVKGEMLLLRGSRPVIHRVVVAGGHYLIPRADDRVLVGSTLVEQGFDHRITLGSVSTLSRAAVELAPETADLELEGCWAGLRPGTPDGLPFIGPLAGFHGLFVNTGHFRNGVVLAPASAELLADQMQGERPRLDPEPFQPDRTIHKAGWWSRVIKI